MKSKWRTIYGLRVRAGSTLHKWLVKHKPELRGWFTKPKPKPVPSPAPVPKPTQLFMYDDINTSLIPKDAEAVAGYIGGHWPTYTRVVAGWPHAKHLSIAVSTLYDADCLDVEPGDATIALAPAWVKRQLKLRREKVKTYNTKLPWVYTSASWGNKLIAALRAAGLVQGQDYIWWSAHYDPARGKHFCSPKCYPGLLHTAQATQFTDKALGRHLDESVLGPGLFV